MEDEKNVSHETEEQPEEVSHETEEQPEEVSHETSEEVEADNALSEVTAKIEGLNQKLDSTIDMLTSVLGLLNDNVSHETEEAKQEEAEEKANTLDDFINLV